MTRQRKNAPLVPPGRARRRGDTPGERVRRRLAAEPELVLTDEELRALADDGIDPEDVRRIAREAREQDEASDHDRDTARDEIEGLVLEQEEGY